jgi:hypothetical protein
MTPDIDAIRKRAEAATEGPWGICKHGVWNLQAPDHPGLGYWDEGHLMMTEDPQGASGFERSEDADFAACARTDIPALLDHIESQAERIKELERREYEPRLTRWRWGDYWKPTMTNRVHAGVGNDALEAAICTYLKAVDGS